MFTLDPRLAADSLWVARLTLSELRLMNNAALPWLILVPQVAHCSELTDLSNHEQLQLWQEVNVCHQLLAAFTPDKINTAAIGNVVSQLHVHVVARYHNDALWPAPIWGQLPAQPYDATQAELRIGQLQVALAQLGLKAEA